MRLQTLVELGLDSCNCACTKREQILVEIEEAANGNTRRL